MSEARLRVLVADDEAMARARLVRLLKALPGVETCGEARDADEVLARVREGGVDVVLLDIHMPGLTGMDALELLPADGPFVIFCTAHPDHAVKAFDAGAIDYVLKPVEPARLAKALDRAREREVLRRARPPAKAAPAPRRLAIPTRAGVVLVDAAEVTHAVLDDELVTVGTTRGDHLGDFTLQELEARLGGAPFVRVHRRALVNLDHVVRLEPTETGGYLARLAKGTSVEVSRQAARELRKSLGIRKGGDDDAEG